MAAKIMTIAMLLIGGAALAGCAPMILGAGAAIAVDEAAEQEGGNLF